MGGAKHTAIREANLAERDWHPADVKAAFEKRGLTLAGLARQHGYRPEVLSEVIRGRGLPSPVLERIIADALDTQPNLIWPSRYGADGASLYPDIRGPGMRKRRHDRQKEVLREFGPIAQRLRKRKRA